jgi:aldose 1-epimerase
MELVINEFQSPNGLIIELINTQSGEKARILPECGGTLCQLFEHISLPGSGPIHQNALHPSALLAPWVNRVRNGNYSFQGRNYQLPITEPALGNAIHGFLARKAFQIIEKEILPDRAILVLQHVYAGDYPGFPFPFVFQLTYELHTNGHFFIRFEIANTGENQMPYAIGWHPYFSFPDTDLSDLEISFSPCSKFISDAQMIPLREELVEYAEPVDLAKESLDNVFRLQASEFHTTTLTNKRTKSSLFIQQKIDDFPFLVVYAPKNEACVAIEPMTANTDAFNTLDGLKTLAPEAKFLSTVEIWLKR